MKVLFLEVYRVLVYGYTGVQMFISKTKPDLEPACSTGPSGSTTWEQELGPC